VRYVAVILLLADLLVGVSCKRQPAATGISVDPAFRSLVPPDTRVLAGIEMEKLKTAAFYKRHESDLNFPLLDASYERIGLDPRRDVSDLLIAWSGERPLFMARGHFSQRVIEQKIAALGAQGRAYKRYTVFGDGENSLVFLNRGIAAAGSTSAVHAAIDLEAEDNGQVPQELQQALGKLPKGDQIWVVSRGGLPFVDLPMRSDYGSVLSNFVGYVRDTCIGAGVDTGVHLVADLTCISSRGAERVHDGLRAAVALGRLTTKDDQQDLLRMYEAIRVDRDNEIVHLHADLSSDLADRLLQYLLHLKVSAG
jgi:hypothetical protein